MNKQLPLTRWGLSVSALDDLISQISDVPLRNRISEEIKRMTKKKKFGLVFEEHLPECTALYGVPIKAGTTVSLKKGEIIDLFVVQSIDRDSASCVNKKDGTTSIFNISELVPVAEFGQPIYPNLVPIDSICNAPDSSLWHSLIEADNYHALQLLEYLYAGKVDCIYIDPPYNTGAKDWKYNNDYVDDTDAYRHSKWLSFIEKRLVIAKKLLNPNDSIMIITIDEKECLHLGCLLEQMFPDARIQMVTSVINPSGVPMKKQFSRAEEYIFFIFIGDASISPHNSDMLHPPKEDNKVRWASLLRSGNNSARSARPNLFYPLFFSKETGLLVEIGDSLDSEQSRDSITVPDNCFVVWPMKTNGTEGTWQLQQITLKEKLSKGYAKYGPWSPGKTQRSISYLAAGTEKALEEGLIEIKGRDENGSIITGESSKKIVPLTVWNQSLHGAGDKGSSLLLGIFKEKRFPFPKSLYAVLDTLRFAVKEKPNALIVDFFAGSGTTQHAVNLLNYEDNGNRRCISITNNEVSEKETKELTKQGYNPGDAEWEKYGIARYVTWPRIVCTTKGVDINGNELPGTYALTDLNQSEGFASNCAFFRLGFMDKDSVSLGKQFGSMIPLLWMKSGSFGQMPIVSLEPIPKMIILPENQFAVLLDESAYMEFCERVRATSCIKTIYFVTNSESGYRDMASHFKGVSTYQLYRDYIDNFKINTTRQ